MDRDNFSRDNGNRDSDPKRAKFDRSKPDDRPPREGQRSGRPSGPPGRSRFDSRDRPREGGRDPGWDAPRDPARDPAVIEKKAADLAKTTGIPLQAARLVALGQQDLNEVIRRMAFQDEVNALIQRYNFNRALATQIALGQVSKEAMLAKRRVDEHLEQSRDRSLVDEAVADGRELQIALHGHRNVRARIKSADKYEVQIEDLEAGTTESVHKLQLKCAWLAADTKKARKAMSWDKERKERAVAPVPRPQDRFACSDKRLGTLMDKKLEVVAITLEGESFTGHISWVSRYEFGLKTKAGVEVVIFRHALDDLKES